MFMSHHKKREHEMKSTMREKGKRLLPLSILSLLAVGGHVHGQPAAQCDAAEAEADLQACRAELAELQETPPSPPPAENREITFASNTGYIDSAQVRSQLRIRYDMDREIKYPDRAEFIYGQCNCNPQGVSPGPAEELDMDEVEVSFEYPLTRRFSVFSEIPYRDVDLRVPQLPTVPPTPARTLKNTGIGDIRAGIKYALIQNVDQYLTLQLRTYFATGEESENLGTGHSTIEPALLYYRRLTNQWTMESEARWWHPTGATNYAGDIVRLGAGLAHTGWGSTLKFSPVAELVGWYVVDGTKTNGKPIGVEDAGGDTVLNLKLGVRIRLDNHPSSVYLGYGKALTGQTWYDQVFRLEFRHNM
jgi:hypothetical protein